MAISPQFWPTKEEALDQEIKVRMRPKEMGDWMDTYFGKSTYFYIYDILLYSCNLKESIIYFSGYSFDNHPKHYLIQVFIGQDWVNISTYDLLQILSADIKRINSRNTKCDAFYFEMMHIFFSLNVGQNAIQYIYIYNIEAFY